MTVDALLCASLSARQGRLEHPHFALQHPCAIARGQHGSPRDGRAGWLGPRAALCERRKALPGRARWRPCPSRSESGEHLGCCQSSVAACESSLLAWEGPWGGGCDPDPASLTWVRGQECCVPALPGAFTRTSGLRGRGAHWHSRPAPGPRASLRPSGLPGEPGRRPATGGWAAGKGQRLSDLPHQVAGVPCPAGPGPPPPPLLVLCLSFNTHTHVGPSVPGGAPVVGPCVLTK